MRILESAPSRYDLGIRLLTLGRLDRAYDRLAERIQGGQRVLDVGCGTGALTLRSARRGAVVKGIDVSAQMLEIAEARVREANLGDAVRLAESGVAELDTEQAGSFDAVTSGLCFSELSDAELVYALKHLARILRPGGLLLVADEVRPPTLLRRLLHTALRAPLVALTWIFTQQTTRPVAALPERLLDAGLEIVSLRASPIGSFSEIVARKPRVAA
jgi:demethylmenaquinone methyltransferase/2-methoxy-6-polyprenyl-1,4-benzoquinol methylase